MPWGAFDPPAERVAEPVTLSYILSAARIYDPQGILRLGCISGNRESVGRGS